MVNVSHRRFQEQLKEIISTNNMCLRKICSSVYQTVLGDAFTTGNARDDTQESRDGRRASAVLGTLVTAIVIAANVIGASNLETISIPRCMREIVFAVFVSLAVVLLFVTFCREGRTNRTESENPLRLQETFLWAFAILSIANCIMRIIKSISCKDDPDECNIFGVSDVLYNVPLIIFILTLVIFIRYYHGHTMQRSVVSHYSQLFIIISLFCIWFFDVSEKMFDPKLPEGISCTQDVPADVKNIDYRLKTSNISQTCDEIKRAIHGQIGPILFTFNVEFTIFALNYVIKLFISTGRSNEPDPLSQLENGERHPPLQTTNPNNILHQSNGERDPLLPREQNTKCYYVFRSIAFLINLPFAVIAALFLWITVQDGDPINPVWEWLRTLDKCMLLMILFYAFHSLRKEGQHQDPGKLFHPQDYIFLGSAFFIMIEHTLSFWAAVKEGCAPQIIKNIADFLIDFYQTDFIIQAPRYIGRNGNTLPSTSNACAYVSITNAFLWGVYSFALMRKFALEMIECTAYGVDFWYKAIHLTSPVAIFYRFHSFTSYYELSKQFRH